MFELMQTHKSEENIDLSWEINQVRFDYKDLLLTWLLWFNSNDPANLVDELTEYRKIH